MVNVKNLFGMAVMASALVACSSNDDVNPNPENPTQKGQAFAAFKINLPTTSGTRADTPTAGTPEFDGGDADEYAVNSGTVLVFKKAGSGEGDYTFVTSATLTDMNPWKKVGSNGVTTEATIVVDLGEKAKVKETGYYALVLLNDKKGENDSKIALPNAGDTFSSWSTNAENAKDSYADISNGIIMANAPEYEGASKEPTTLVPISGIYSSKEEAAANSATNIYVERGLAKVTVDPSKYVEDEYGNGTAIEGGTYDGAKVAILGWNLDVMNKKTYPVHVTAGLSTGFGAIWSTDRFYDGNNEKFKRVYWAKDPNYSNADNYLNALDENFYTMNRDGSFTDTPYDGSTITRGQGGGNVTNNDNFVEADQSCYCYENTFDINNMTQNQTTRVVFMAKYTPSDMTDEGANEGYNGTFFMLGTRPETWTPAKFLEQVKTYVVEAYNAANPDDKIDNVDKVTIDDTNLKAAVAPEGSFDSEKDFFDTYLKRNIKVNDVALVDADVLDNVGKKLGTVYTYVQGISYYVARIKHFNGLTPWSAGDPTYGTDNAKYLGRYGMVRNNWYSLTVNKISNPGSPTVPEVTSDPDDENKSYISVSINILDWAKRSQSVDL